MGKSILAMGLMAAAALPWAAHAEEYRVEMKFNEDSGDVYFEPKKLEVKSGDTVTFVHADPYNVHNVMFEPNGIPKGADIPMMSPETMNEGDSWKVTFTESGTYKYHCHPHYDMGMMGEIIVDRPSAPAEMNMDEEMGGHHSGGDHHGGGHHE
jgi:plastocyanin